MKKFLLTVLALSVVFGVGSCSKKSNGVSLIIGASSTPHAVILNHVKDDMRAKGYNLQVKEMNDYVTPNSALVSGDIDANFFQHIPYLNSNEKWTDKLVSAFDVHIEPMGIYSKKFKSIEDIPNGAAITIPNDPTNGGRALLLFQTAGLIKLKDDAGLEATALDIVDNPKKLIITSIEAAQIPRTLDDVDAAAINGNYALQANMSPQEALFLEGGESPYVNIIVVQIGKENDPSILALKEVLLSDKVRNFIKTTWADNSVLPVF
ncbi:MAG: MetQ/NlpA family ABC transporter substrate-binding protein [Termitinemataceae bacterium]|nr:MAG: MetQ/NlpA family ABC transporter substrate-binding protein [Termitinemataceae bacterium]